MVRDFHRFINEQVPCVGAVPVRRAKKAGVGGEEKITSLVTIVKVLRDSMGDPIV